MIDTIRFRIKLTPEVYNLIREKSIDFTKYDNVRGVEIFRISKNEVPLGSFDRKVSLFLPDEDFCMLEFSVPKFINGQNVYLISFNDFKWAISSVYNSLTKFFGKFIPPETWEITRLDLCYAWKFKEELQAEVVLDILSSFNFPRKKKSVYDTSVMYIGSYYSLKFYMKYPEFYKHDFRTLRDFGHLDFAYKMLDVSRGVLRFEVTMRRQFLKFHFKKDKIYISDLNGELLGKLLKMQFTKYMGGFNMKYKTKSDIQKILKTYYGDRKGRQLYIFYIFMTTEGKKNTKKYYASSTVFQYMRELRKANIPMTFKQLKDFEMDLSIPSTFAVNNIEVGVSPTQTTFAI